MVPWAAIYGALLLLPHHSTEPDAEQDTVTRDSIPKARIGVTALALPGSEASERQRLGAPPFGSSKRPQAHLLLIAPEVRTVINSGLPFSINEGTMWAGRGRNVLVIGGLALHAGPLTVQLAPQYTTSENRRFQVIPFPQFTTTPARSVWANPFHPPASSIDLPYRPGADPIARLTPGQSRIALQWRAVTAGVSTEHRWWGPAMRHPLVLGASSDGIPHAFVETARPLNTRLGQVTAQWIVGTLQESAVFDDDPSNDRRTLAGALVTLTPRKDSALTIGIARVVMGTTRRAGATGTALGRAFDVLRSVGQPVRADLRALPTTGRDQITSLFARYAFPEAGFESWIEWARFAEPVSFGDFLEYPGYSQGYTMGVQWSRPVNRSGALHGALRGARFRLAAEATNTEPDASIRVRPVAIAYTSRTVPQGFTHGGRMLANPLGPGASGQWFAADLFAPRFRVGAFAGRIRWDNGTLWQPIVPQVKLEDITLYAGLRGSVRIGPDKLASRVGVEYTSAVRLSYLFQSKLLDWASGRNGGVDLPNRTLAVTWSTVAFR
jgi:hypothetical protein